MDEPFPCKIVSNFLIIEKLMDENLADQDKGLSSMIFHLIFLDI